MNPEMINKLNGQREAEVKDFEFTKSFMESNAYDFTVKARTLEEAVEIAKDNCPLYSDIGFWGVRYAEGEGDELLQWGEGSNKQSLQLEQRQPSPLHNELLAFVRKLALRNDNGHYVNENMDVSLYDKLADICEEAENILKSNRKGLTNE